MMNCLGCYTEIKSGYCLPCRKKLFDKSKVQPVLPFDAPQAANMSMFQEHSRRMSISGVQLKYSARLQQDELILDEQNSGYILKPIPPAKHLVNIEDAPENEHLTMQIAAQVFNIITAANALIRFSDGQPAYLTRRFDVKPGGGKYLQEDFAQLTSRSKYTHGETFKYDGSYEEIGLLIKEFVPAAMPALEKFFQLVVFNYVISNGDAHLKNFSLLRDEQGEYHLTPAYDLMSTVIHTPDEPDTALDLYEGDMKADFFASYGYYGRENFMELANRLGLVATRAGRIIDQFAAGKESVQEMVKRSFLSPAIKKKYAACFAEKIMRLQ